MTTFAPPRHRGSSFLHRHHSDMSRHGSPPCSTEPAIFEGTSTVTQNRKTALQRVIEAHDALELKHQAESATNTTATTTMERSDSAHTLIDPLGLEFRALHLPNGEVRTFRYFLRMWDQSVCADQELEDEIKENKDEFEVAAIKHFFRRIALWHESEEVMEKARLEIEKRTKKNKKERDSALGSLWSKEKGRQDHSLRDELKEVTTREGLAQLLWTLMHDHTRPLAPELFAECVAAVKMKYGITR